MPVETPALAEMRERLDSAKPTSWIEAIVASISWRRRISSIPSFGISLTCPEVQAKDTAGLILDDQSKKGLRNAAGASYNGANAKLSCKMGRRIPVLRASDDRQPR